MRVWDTAEFAFKGKTSGNPFTDYEIYGEPYYSVGTTCYAWAGQIEKLRKD